MWPRGSSQWKQFTRAFDSCLSKNHKVNCRISYCLCQKKEVHRRRIILCCVFAQWLSMVRRLDPLVWCTAFAWRLNCKTTCLKEYLEWRYCDLTWRGYICNKQESNQVQRPLQCKWWQGDRNDGCQMEKLWVSQSILTARAKKSASLHKMFTSTKIYGSVLISIISLYKYCGSVLVACW